MPGDGDVIVKVQVSATRKMLVYNADRSLFFEGTASDDVFALMDGEDKRFFFAALVGGKISLEDPAPEQSW